MPIGTTSTQHAGVIGTRAARARPGVGRAPRRGFTLIELLVALAVAALLVSIAAPSFRDTVGDMRLVGEQNRLAKAFRQARSEAIKRGAPVTVCASDDGASCSGGWSDGWLIFGENAGGILGTPDAGEPVYAVQIGDPTRRTIAARALVRPNPAAAVSSVRFGPRGRADWTLGTITLCDARGAPAARALIVNGAGGLRSTEPGPDGAALDATGNALTC